MTTRLNPTYRITEVPPGTMVVSQNPQDAFKTVNLASSMAIIAISRKPMIAGILHFLMPESHIVSAVDNPLKFADLSIPLFIQELRRQEMDFSRASVALIGGSQLFNFGGDMTNMLNVGMRNIVTAQSLLQQEGCRITHKETGGNRPRNVTITIATGQVDIVIPGHPATRLIG
jgi:chemotaxis protein CheD